MARYLINFDRDPGIFIEGTFEKMKDKLSGFIENNPTVSDRQWEEIQLLEPKDLPYKVAGMTFFKEVQNEQNTSRTE